MVETSGSADPLNVNLTITYVSWSSFMRFYTQNCTVSSKMCGRGLEMKLPQLLYFHNQLAGCLKMSMALTRVAFFVEVELCSWCRKHVEDGMGIKSFHCKKLVVDLTSSKLHSGFIWVQAAHKIFLGACPQTPLVGTHTCVCMRVLLHTTIILLPSCFPPCNSKSCMKPCLGIHSLSSKQNYVGCKWNSFGNCIFPPKTLNSDIQWNLRKRTPPIMETSTMRIRVHGPELFPIL